MTDQRLGSTAGRDRLYVVFFLVHAFSTVAVDLQPLLPKAWRLGLFSDLLDFYVKNWHDPLMIGALTANPNYLWFRWFLLHEGLFFLPCFLLGIGGLLRGTYSIYPLLLAYGAAASTTTATCLIVLVFGDHEIPLNSTQLLLLLSAYVPFVMTPSIIFVDMYRRIHLLINPPSFQTNGKTSASSKRTQSSSHRKLD